MRFHGLIAGALIATQLLAGCDECEQGHFPCAGKASFFVCTDVDREHFEWEERECPGVEPFCTDLPRTNDHRCEDKRPPELCESVWRVPVAAFSAPPPELISVVDLDGNGRLDLVLLTREHNVERLMQREDGRFERPERVAQLDEGTRPYLADLDGDGRVDLLAVSISREITFSTRLGRGDGSFADPIATSASGASVVTVGDVDADGKAEAIAVDRDTITVLRPLTQTTRASDLQVKLPRFSDPSRPREIQAVQISDLDGDGRPELIAILFRAVHVFTRPDDAWMTDARGWSADETGHFDVADFNHDGLVDRVSGDDPLIATRPRVFVETGDGDGSFDQRGEAHRLPMSGQRRFADFDGDGNLDLAHGGSEFLTVLRGRGDGSLEAPQSFRLPNNTGFYATADLDADGAVDLLGQEGESILVASRACLAK